MLPLYLMAVLLCAVVLISASLCYRRQARLPCFAGPARGKRGLVIPQMHQLRHGGREHGASCSSCTAHHHAGETGSHIDVSTLRPFQIALWLLQNGNSPTEHPDTLLQVAEELLSRPDVDSLSLAMATWGLANAGVLDNNFFGSVAMLLTTRMVELETLPRAPEALSNTAAAYAKLFRSCDDPEITKKVSALMQAIAETAAKCHMDFALVHWVSLSRSLAAVGSTELPFGLAAPPSVAAAVHAQLNRLPEENVLFQSELGFKILQIDNFLSEQEVALLLEVASPFWQPSKIYDEAVSLRTSDTASLRGPSIAEANVVSIVMERAAALVGLEEGNCETLQMVRYQNEDQYYRAHYDLMDEGQHQQLLLGGQRVATVLIYLSSLPPDAGGETMFPEVPPKGLLVSPTFATAIVWPNVDPTGMPEMLSRHAALPLQGEDSAHVKVAVNCWLRAFPDASRL